MSRDSCISHDANRGIKGISLSNLYVSTGRASRVRRSGTACTASVPETRSTTLCSATVDSLGNTRARASPTPASTRTASKYLIQWAAHPFGAGIRVKIHSNEQIWSGLGGRASGGAAGILRGYHSAESRAEAHYEKG